MRRSGCRARANRCVVDLPAVGDPAGILGKGQKAAAHASAAGCPRSALPVVAFQLSNGLNGVHSVCHVPLMTVRLPLALFRPVIAAVRLTLLAGVSSVMAQELVPQEQVPFLFRTWQTADDLPHNTVSALTQASDGCLWLGTHGGLARFDGVNCRVFGVKNGLCSMQISKLLHDRAGGLWIGTIGGGLSRLSHGEFESWSTASGIAGDTVNALLEDAEGAIWVAGEFRWSAEIELIP